MSNNQGPIAIGWQTVLDHAPDQNERDQAEAYRGLFYSGASWLWEIVKSFDNNKELKQYITLEIEAELEQWRSQRELKRHEKWKL